MTSEQRETEAAIRQLVEAWARAVQAQDLDAVLADHSADIQMFDVPPPNEVRGIAAYREKRPKILVRSGKPHEGAFRNTAL